MKRNSLLILALGISVLAIFNSCEPTATITPPLVTVNPTTDLTAKPGETLTYQMLINSDTELKSANFMAMENTAILADKDTVFPAGIEAAILDIQFTVPQSMTNGAVLTLSFKASNTEQTVVTRTVNVVIPPGEIHTYTAVIMADLKNPDGSSFYSIEDNKLMNINSAIAASAEVDLIYYYGVTNMASLCAPADVAVEEFLDIRNESIVRKFTTRNNTKLSLVTMTVADFNAVTNDVAIKAKTPTSTSTAVTKLVKDNVIWCESVTGKKALIKVVNIVGTQSNSLITIEVKVQK